jgi:hypothetical protein
MFPAYSARRKFVPVAEDSKRLDILSDNTDVENNSDTKMLHDVE